MVVLEIYLPLKTYLLSNQKNELHRFNFHCEFVGKSAV